MAAAALIDQSRPLCQTGWGTQRPRQKAMADRMVASKTARGKVGRPPLERAGEVEERILDAAKTVFLANGFEGASVDEIAQTARAGKPTIYARFPSKAALFAAVIGRQAARNTQYENLVPQGRSLRARLVSVGLTLIDRAFSEEILGLMR